MIYAFREEFAQHEAARAVIGDLATDPTPWALPVFTIAEFLRVVTHPRYLDPPGDRARALGNLDRLIAGPGCRVLNPGERFWELLRRAVEDADIRGNVVFDAQIVAVCLEHGVDTILTEDRSFRRFSSITVRTLETPEER